jgi:hypothetical protein
LPRLLRREEQAGDGDNRRDGAQEDRRIFPQNTASGRESKRQNRENVEIYFRSYRLSGIDFDDATQLRLGGVLIAGLQQDMAEHDELLALVAFAQQRTLEKLEAEAALRELQSAVDWWTNVSNGILNVPNAPTVSRMPSLRTSGPNGAAP